MFQSKSNWQSETGWGYCGGDKRPQPLRNLDQMVHDLTDHMTTVARINKAHEAYQQCINLTSQEEKGDFDLTHQQKTAVKRLQDRCLSFLKIVFEVSTDQAALEAVQTMQKKQKVDSEPQSESKDVKAKDSQSLPGIPKPEWRPLWMSPLAHAMEKQEAKVVFLDDASSDKFRVYLEKGKLYQLQQSSSCCFGNSRSMTLKPITAHLTPFIIDIEGNLYFGDKSFDSDKFKHSSFKQGLEVAMAGEMEIVDGVIRKINAQSGHYTPDNTDLTRAVQYLHKIRKIDLSECMVEINVREVINNPGMDTDRYIGVSIPAKILLDFDLSNLAVTPDHFEVIEKLLGERLLGQIRREYQRQASNDSSSDRDESEDEADEDDLELATPLNRR